MCRILAFCTRARINDPVLLLKKKSESDPGSNSQHLYVVARAVASPHRSHSVISDNARSADCSTASRASL
jgi:hypothetical protein